MLMRPDVASNQKPWWIVGEPWITSFEEAGSRLLRPREHPVVLSLPCEGGLDGTTEGRPADLTDSSGPKDPQYPPQHHSLVPVGRFMGTKCRLEGP
jgi:hypothetical protein